MTEPKNGFTLIELSIVLVIIGLIIGGVMMGQELLQTSYLRQTISQKEKFDTAANTFKLKYNCLPGDCLNNQFGFINFSNNGVPSSVDANGDGVVGSYVATETPFFECLNFFYWLRVAGLQNEPQQYLTFPIGGDTANAVRAGAMTPYPPIRVSQNSTGTGGAALTLGGWFVGHTNGTYMSGFSGIFSGHYFAIIPNLGTWIRTSLKPSNISSIDGKVDDGLPLTGGILAIDDHMMGTNPNGFQIPDNSGGTCIVTSNSPNTYGTGNTATCNMAWKAAF